MPHPIAPLPIDFFWVNSRPFFVHARLFSLTLNSMAVIPARAHRSALDLVSLRVLPPSPRLSSWMHRYSSKD